MVTSITNIAKRVVIPQDSVQKLTRWYAEDLMSSTPVLQGSVFGWLFGLFKQQAVTISESIHLTYRAPDLVTLDGVVLLGHELYHVLQQRNMGWWKFLVVYLWYWRPRHITRGYEHPLEIPAYRREDKIRSTLEGDVR